MLDREAFRGFVHALWDASQGDGEPRDPAMSLGLRAVDIYLGIELVSPLVTDAAKIIKQLEESRSPVIQVSDYENPNSAVSRRTAGSVAADRTRELAGMWQNYLPPPRKPTPPTPEPVLQLKIQLPNCIECKQPFIETDPRFIPGSPVGTCCGDKVIARQKGTSQ